MLYSLTVILLAACSSSYEVEENKLVTQENMASAMPHFEISFKQQFGNLVITRTTIADTPENQMDSIMAATGDKVCQDLIAPSEELLSELNISDADFNDVITEVAKENAAYQIPIRELKCFTALSLYDTYLAQQVQTRASIWQYIECAALGQTVYGGFKIPTKQIVRLAASSMVKRFVPYVGWGWAVASTAQCIANL